jgi:hypothetical protein
VTKGKKYYYAHERASQEQKKTKRVAVKFLIKGAIMVARNAGLTVASIKPWRETMPESQQWKKRNSNRRLGVLLRE